ncbi:metal ABC transporter permease [Corynebacterium sp. ES2794-CONJ1]|uniref:metal ABC transporter permease n=1 Tax=unclassified Corynebacterium TaxID=2624378 RepID=UPI002166F73D|nr:MULTISPECIES: metal ABC transporter permease [unclassified Corynebacterium]MCS4490158.1 metal ABC transporter permease [Corynebacterium sp. ES2775-CONJ]MCS4492030.1 metal ABC transporter permease [Corynebacterium sp. ES2715-CONJ3]MCS4532135.1 metal ABC transporter permease [Corynebacterium sp. ES2730-CONJ]MCU9519537.1 metal ABC transporter permease [Corynebacterium sp. ES2794-CONJ1]
MLDILFLPIIEVIVVGGLMGAVGALAVLGKRVFFSESLSHGTFPGAVLGVVVGQFIGGDLSLWLFAGAALCCIPLALLMRYLAGLEGISATAAAGIVLTLGYSLGIFLLRWFQPLPLKVESFLTGSLVSVNHMDVYSAIGVAVVATIVLVTFGRNLSLYYFDPVAFKISHARAGRSLVPFIAELLTLSLLCASMVVAIPAVGSILSIALLVAPAAALKDFTRTFFGLIIAGTVAGIAIGLTGLGVAVYLNYSTGGTVAVTAGCFYLLSRLILSAQQYLVPASARRPTAAIR